MEEWRRAMRAAEERDEAAWKAKARMFREILEQTGPDPPPDVARRLVAEAEGRRAASSGVAPPAGIRPAVLIDLLANHFDRGGLAAWVAMRWDDAGIPAHCWRAVLEDWLAGQEAPLPDEETVRQLRAAIDAMAGRTATRRAMR